MLEWDTAWTLTEPNSHRAAYISTLSQISVINGTGCVTLHPLPLGLCYGEKECNLPTMLLESCGPAGSGGGITNSHAGGIRHMQSTQSERPVVEESMDAVIAVPPHPLGIKPAGNAYTSDGNLKSAAGSLAYLPDELIVQILEFLDATSLLKLGKTCKALYAFAQFEELWKALFIEYVYIFYMGVTSSFV